MIVLDRALCDLCAKLYNPTVTWDLLWTEASWGLTAAKTTIDGVDVIVHRGSETQLDWYDDLGSELPMSDRALGNLPRGFSEPLDLWFEANMSHMAQDMILIGHSLGAARAVEHAGMLVAKGLKPRAVVVWGEPKAGMHALAVILGNTVVHSYRNRRDPVCTVPITIGLLDWVHGHDIVALDAPPAANDSWGPLADHHIELYQLGMQKLNPQPMV